MLSSLKSIALRCYGEISFATVEYAVREGWHARLRLSNEILEHFFKTQRPHRSL